MQKKANWYGRSLLDKKMNQIGEDKDLARTTAHLWFFHDYDREVYTSTNTNWMSEAEILSETEMYRLKDFNLLGSGKDLEMDFHSIQSLLNRAVQI